MSLNASDLSTLSRLLDEALDLAPAQRQAWLTTLPDVHEHLLPTLREMLDEHDAPEHSRFLAGGPQLADARTEAASARVGDLIGPYRLMREIGRGGMACVWLAERPDGVVKRDVALKMPLLTLTASTQVERFERERDVLAMLNHPQIARLYDAGVGPSGQPYIVMEHVPGQTITEACDTARLDVPARLRMFLQVLAAVDHAHKHLVVHRDIKPSNVFVDATGQVKLLDFGIAKLLGAAPGSQGPTPLTREGGGALTPRYAAPEQMDGRPISTATDVYSLGVLLYELLVGQLPHAAAQASMAQAVDATLHTEALRPSRVSVDAATSALRGLPDPQRLRSLLAGDLDTIVLKALRKPPGERYSSVERFAADIQRFLGNRPIAARPPTLAHWLRLFARRHRGAVGAGAVGVVSAFALAALLWQQHTMTAAQALRAAAVREFMMDMIEDVNPDDTHVGSGEVTGKQMVAAALSRAHDRFKGQPVLLGEVLGELGLMLQRLGDDGQSRQTLAEALALLERNAINADASLNKVRAFVAQAHFADNELARAGELAGRALAACRSQDADCAKARALAGDLLAKIDLRAARLPQAMQHRRESVVDFERAFGARHAETAVAWGQLAATAREAGELEEADRAIQKAQALAQNVVLRSQDRVFLSRARAVIDFDLGRYAASRRLLQELVGRTADRAERAQQWRLLATAELALGEANAALHSSEQALALVDPARPTANLWLAHQAHARALSLLGLAEPASAEMEQSMQGLQALGFPAQSIPVLRTRRWMAEIRARQGDLGAAREQIDSAVAAMATDQPDHLAVEHAQALDLQGCIQRDLGLLAEAAASHARARPLLARRLPADHPLLVRNALYRQRVEALAAGTPPARQAFEALANAYSQRFAPTSNWPRLIAAQRRPSECPAQSQRACLLIL